MSGRAYYLSLGNTIDGARVRGESGRETEIGDSHPALQLAAEYGRFMCLGHNHSLGNLLPASLFNKVATFFKKITGQKDVTILKPVAPAQGTPAGSREKGQRSRRDATRPERSRRASGTDHKLARSVHGRPGGPPHAKQEPRPEPRGGAREIWNVSEFKVPPVEGRVRFHDFGLPAELMHAIFDLGFQYCTPIQSGVLGVTLSGGDASGRAQTGTGKTAAFLITILTHLNRVPAPKNRKKGVPRALILAPTRELVLQIDKDAKSLSKHMQITSLAVFGGMEYRKQQQVLTQGHIDIVAATPGRLLDFKRNGNIDLSAVEILVIDEADRMLDMGFIPDVRRIIESTPMKGKRQTMFFSATLTPDVMRLAGAWTRNAVQVDVTPPKDISLSTIDQIVYITTDEEKFTLLFNLITRRELERVMVFANRRDETQFLKARLSSRGIRCGLLSGDVSQDQRVKTLEGFRSGRFKVLVATDVAARGLHIDGVSHVINYSLPTDPEDYLHRIGRTGRAGATGTSVSFATETEAYEIPEIEQFLGRSLPAVHPEPELLTVVPPLPVGEVEPQKRRSAPPRRHSRPRPGRRGSRPTS
jgi:ATP-dependent RNA helicase RhlB